MQSSVLIHISCSTGGLIMLLLLSKCLVLLTSSLFLCGTDRRGMDRFLYRGECRESCPPGHYHSEHTCVPCSGHCEVCLDSKHCKRCSRGYYLNQNICQKHSCREGKHPSVEGKNTYFKLVQKYKYFGSCSEIHNHI